MFLSLGLVNNEVSSTRKDVNIGFFKLLTNLIYCKGFFARSRLSINLFPSLSTIQDISNKGAFFPKLCAADDLDLSLSGQSDQIEFFNNFNTNHVPQLQEGRYNESYAPTKYEPPKYEAPSYSRRPNPQQQSIQSYAEDFTNNPIFPELEQASSHPIPSFTQHVQGNIQQNSQDGGYSHYYLNMIGMQNPEFHNTPPYFNDFSSNELNVYGLLSSSISSTDSNISPLDDEFFKKLSSEEYTDHFAEFQPQPVKKRKFESVSSTVLANMTDEMSSISSPNSDNSETSKNLVFVKKEPKEIKLDTKKSKTETAHLGETTYDCSHCDASFKVKGYLSRHLKKHSSSKAFLCPFYEDPAGSSSGTRCHPTGGFSRRDTYKTHLKALHFIYPPGTKSNERNSISGRCAGCFQYFENNLKWLEKHIESGDCKGTVQFKKTFNQPHHHDHLDELKI